MFTVVFPIPSYFKTSGFYVISALIWYSRDSAHHLHFNIILPFTHISLLVRVRVCVRVCACVCVFMPCRALLQLVTLAQCVAPRNTTDVQMFLLGKQTEQRPFYPGQRDCQNKSWPPLDLSSNSDSIIHRQITICSLLQTCIAVCLLYLHLDYIKFMCVFICLYIDWAAGEGLLGWWFLRSERFKIL